MDQIIFKSDTSVLATHQVIIYLEKDFEIIFNTDTPKEIQESFEKAIIDNNCPRFFRKPPTNIIIGEYPEEVIVIPIKNILCFIIQEIK